MSWNDLQQALALESDSGGGARPSVVVIDDDDSVRSSLELVLSEDYQVLCFPDAESGVEAVDAETSVVILDIKMQGKDGFWAYSAIRKKNELVPIVFHSAHQDVKDPFDVMNEYQPFGYLMKEGDLELLFKTVQRAGAYLARTRNIEARNQELQLVVDDRTDDLQRYARALEEHVHALNRANQVKRVFLANMSHELRTPLNSIIGFSKLLIERVEGTIDTRFLRFLNNILASGEHLLHLINNLLDLSKIEAGKMEAHTETVAIHELADGVCEVMTGYIRDRRISIDCRVESSLTEVVVDTAKLRQILFNLLSNAVKFSPPSASVTLKIDEVSSADSPLDIPSFRISVIDQGVGIAPEDQPGIFGAFEQVGLTGNRPAGTGLGLSIVQQFVRLLGGEISLESALGLGTTFRVVLPIDGDQVEVDPGVFVTSVEDVRPRVLVVEEDRLAFRRRAQRLELAGILAVRAWPAALAMQRVREIGPAVVALDPFLPGHWEFLRALNTQSETSHIPVVAASSVRNRVLGGSMEFDRFVTESSDVDFRLKGFRGTSGRSEVLREQQIAFIGFEDPAFDRWKRRLEAQDVAAKRLEVRDDLLEDDLETVPGTLLISVPTAGVNCFRLAKTLRCDERLSGVSIWAVSKEDLSVAELQALASDWAETLADDLQSEDLVAAVASLLERPN